MPHAQKKHTSSSHKKNSWSEQQHKYTQKVKEMFGKVHEHMHHSKVDHKALLASHKKNMEALGEANKMAVEVMKSIAQLQGQFVRQTFEDINNLMREMMSHKPGQPINFSMPINAMQNSVEKTMTHAHNVSNTLKHSGQAIHACLHDRMEEGTHEIKSHIEKHRKH